MRHIYQDFLNPIAGGIEHVDIVIEKNTKKAVNEALEQMDALIKGNKNIIVHVDATNVLDPEKIALIVGFSMFQYRNMRGFGVTLTKVKLAESLQVTELTDIDNRNFTVLKGRGGDWRDYPKVAGANWYRVNAQLLLEIDHLLARLKDVREKYQPYIEMISKERSKREFRRRWNFSTRQQDLLGLYNRCFNEIDQIMNPDVCCNPNPSFQRDLVWSEEKKRSFIESILNEIPIGSFYVNRTDSYDPYFKLGEGLGTLLWDGKQRIHALDDFIKGKFAVMVNGEMIYYYDDPAFFYVKFSSCHITIYQSCFETLREIIEAYVVINSSQVKHTDEDLQKAIDYLESQGQPS